MEKLPCVLFLLDPLFPFNIFEYYTCNKQIDRLSVNQKGGSQGILSTKEFILPYFLFYRERIKTIKKFLTSSTMKRVLVVRMMTRSQRTQPMKKKHLLKNVGYAHHTNIC